MPRQITCTAPAVKNTSAAFKGDPEKDLCGSTAFQQAVSIQLQSKFETKTGQPNLEMTPVFICLICGCPIDLAEEVKKGVPANFRLN